MKKNKEKKPQIVKKNSKTEMVTVVIAVILTVVTTDVMLSEQLFAVI